MASVHDVDPQLIAADARLAAGAAPADGSWDAGGPHASHGDLPAPGRRGRPTVARRPTSPGPSSATPARPARPTRHASTIAQASRSRVDPGPLHRWPWSPTPCWPSTHNARRGAVPRPAGVAEEVGGRRQVVWWEQPAGARTAFYGAGRGGQVETTALATLALSGPAATPTTTRKALAWLGRRRTPTAPGTRRRRRCWHSRRCWPAPASRRATRPSASSSCGWTATDRHCRPTRPR